MSIDANIPLMVNPPPSPLITIGGLMQMRSQMTEAALRAAQVEQAKATTENIQAQAQQRNRDLADENTIQAAQTNPDTARKLSAGDFSDIEGKVQPKTLTAVKAARDAEVERRATLDKTQLENINTKQAQLTKFLDGIKQAPAEQQADLYAAGVPNLVAEGIVPHGALPATINTPEDVDKIAATHALYSGLTAAALGRKKEQAATAASEATATKDIAQAREAGAQADIGKVKLDLMKNAVDQFKANPQSGGTIIDGTLPPVLDATANTAYKQAYAAAMGQGNLEAAQKIVEAAANHAASLSPQKRAIDLQQKVKEEQTLAPLKTQQEIAARVGTTQAMNPAAPEVANVPLAERGKVQDEYKKSLTDMGTAAADANRLHTLIQQAQGGNKAAPGLIPIAELRQLVNRVNSVELRSVGTGAGNIVDRVEGFLNHATEGQPIPPEVMQGMDQLSGLAMANAEQKHAGEVKAINIARKASLAPKTVEDLGYSKPGAMVKMKAPNGAVSSVPADQVEHYKQRGAVVVP